MDIAGWEKLYRAGERGHEDSPTILLEEIAGQLAPGAAIDLACGTGRNALYLAAQGWQVKAFDGSRHAIETLRQRALERGLPVHSDVVDLSAPDLELPADSFDLAVIAFYLQRDLFAKAKAAVRHGGVVIAIVHTPDKGEEWNEKRATADELLRYFDGWEILWNYAGPSRDPAHRRPVAELAARRL